jgi:hypothetical protein
MAVSVLLANPARAKAAWGCDSGEIKAGSLRTYWEIAC